MLTRLTVSAPPLPQLSGDPSKDCQTLRKGLDDLRKYFAEFIQSLNNPNVLTITKAQVDTTPVGSSDPSTGAFTTLTASGQITSTVATGTAPLVVASATKVSNLYAARAALADTVTTNANLTGAVTSAGNATSLGSFSSAQLAAALTDETGSGAAVFANSPTLTTPTIGSMASTAKVTNLNADLLDGMDSTPLTPYTPVITPSSGSITTQTGTGYYQALGNFVWFSAEVVINNAGTAAGANAVFISLPSTPLGAITQICIGRECNATGTLLQGVMQNANATASIQTYSNGAHLIQTGYKFAFSGVYRT
jgi:hypothetical protein